MRPGSVTVRCDDRPIRIGTWNLDGKRSAATQRFVENARCDVWLLTEVHDRFEIPGGEMVRSSLMGENKTYAAVWSNRPLIALPAPHEASAAALLGELLVCSSVLPWYACRSIWPDKGPDIPAITAMTVDRLRPRLQSGRLVIWGGDFNNAMTGPYGPGTKRGRVEIQRLADDLGLRILTEDLPHALPGLSSIDHIAVPASWSVHRRDRLVADHVGRRLSDHDAYLADVSVQPAATHLP